MWVQMGAMEMFGTFLPMLFMIGVWKCHLDTLLFTRISHFVTLETCLVSLNFSNVLRVCLIVTIGEGTQGDLKSLTGS